MMVFTYRFYLDDSNHGMDKFYDIKAPSHEKALLLLKDKCPTSWPSPDDYVLWTITLKDMIVWSVNL